MNRTQFIRKLSKEAGFTASDTRYFVNAFIKVFAEAAEKEEEIRINGFGRMWYKKLPVRNGYNPETGKYEEFPACTVIKFSMSHTLRDAVKEPDKRAPKPAKPEEKIKNFIEKLYFGNVIDEEDN